MDIPVIPPLKYNLLVRSFRSCPWDEVRECLGSAPWQVMNLYDSVNDMWSFFQGILFDCLESFAPVKTVICSNSHHRPTPWLSSSLLEDIKKKQRAKRKAKLTGTSDDIMNYKRLKNHLKVCICQAKVSYIQKLIHRTGRSPHLSGQLWAGVNSVLGHFRRKQASIDTSLSLDSVNEFFRSVAVSDDHQPASTFCRAEAESDSSFHFHEIDRSVVLHLLQNLDEKKSMGPDGISARFLKEVAAEVVDPLTMLYNKSLKTGVFPDDWKRCNVTPVHKGGSSSAPGNYRPISVVPVVAKILEKVVAQQLSSYFEDSECLSPFEGAYRRGRSTEQLLLVAVDYITQSLDQSLTTCVAFLDLRKVFDSLDHHILLS